MKEILNKKIILCLFSLSIILIVFINQDGQNLNDINNNEDVFSVKKESEKTITSFNSVISDQIKEQEKDDPEIVSRSYLKKLQNIDEKLDFHNKKLGAVINSLELEHKNTVKEMVQNGIYVSPIRKISPKLKLVLSRALLIRPSELEIEDLNDSIYTAGDWRLLKLLANSTDLELLLNNDELDYEYVKLANLKRLYGP